jgi:hypothetical protein
MANSVSSGQLFVAGGYLAITAIGLFVLARVVFRLTGKSRSCGGDYRVVWRIMWLMYLAGGLVILGKVLLAEK